MRISTNQIFQNGVDTMIRQQAALARTQNQLSTGRRILSPSDDPSGSVQALQFESRISQTNQYQRNLDLAEQRVRFSEVTLGAVSNDLQRIRELAVRANNATETDETRRYIALEMQEILDGLVDLANTRDANGEYLFAGYQSQTKPFVVDAAGTVIYQGDSQSRQVDISPVRKVTVSDPGNAVFEGILDGNGIFRTLVGNNTGSGVIDSGQVVDLAAWNTNAADGPFEIRFTQVGEDTTYQVVDSGGNFVPVIGEDGTPTTDPVPYVSGSSIQFLGIQVEVQGSPNDGDTFAVRASEAQSMFASIQDMIDALNTGVGSSTAPVNNAINRGLTELDNLMGHVLDTRATMGARLNVLESQENMNADQILQMKTTLSEIRDLDYAEAISRFSLQQVSLQAAQLSYMQVQRLSLFDYF
ncbi:flagellar hook-associated protein 3 [Ectothiorhodospira shaposhnikovii]|uniref:flagellar hook-associated protein FlgL n=1 Tax=Ectothiorhodospira shaposhnikovii TaxID=1054 RepID=UPI001906EC6A|nr:flagellar hook-associated protein FlgL [Ectothiorhodospira shaposhnikovii]MBK1673444.1 flagellar hook-associated protein 3 [Ectothiorhodospira shaposhnikovii]